MRVDYNSRQTLSGLGTSSASEYAHTITSLPIFPAALNPIINAIASVVDSIFGWGDPNTIDDIFNGIIKLRLTLADVHKQMNIPDEFHLPIDYTGAEDEIADLAMFIENEYLKRVPVDWNELDQSWNNLGSIDNDANGAIWHAYPSSDRRTQSYTVLKSLQSELQSIQEQYQNAQLTAPPPSAAPMVAPQDQGPSGTVTPPIPDGQTPNNSAPSFSPLLIGGAGMLLLLLLASGDGD